MLILTQMKTEKKAKVTAALALLLPRRNSLGAECCHWLARKQKPMNQVPAQRTEVAGEKRGGEESGLRVGRWGWSGAVLSTGEQQVTHGYLHFNQLKLNLKHSAPW